MRKVKCIDAEGLPFSALVPVVCECGETALYCKPFDAQFTSNVVCSDACESIRDARNSWENLYGASEQFEDAYLNESSLY